MLEILQKIHAGTETGCRAGSKTIRKVGSGSEKIISDPQHHTEALVRIRKSYEKSKVWLQPDFLYRAASRNVSGTRCYCRIV
jgi:hypothetical protein